MPSSSTMRRAASVTVAKVATGSQSLSAGVFIVSCHMGQRLPLARASVKICLSRIEKSQFLTDRNVTMSAGGSRSTTIIHWSDGGTSCDGRGAVKPAAAGGGSPQGQALRRLVRRRESEPTDDVVQPVW